MFDIASLMAQAQKALAEMESKKAALEAELNEASVTGTAGAPGGAFVEVTLSGAREVRRVKISPEAQKSESAEILEDLVFVALADALRQADAVYESKMQELGAGMEIGGMDISSVKDLLR